MSVVLEYLLNMTCTIAHRVVHAIVKFPFYQDDDRSTKEGESTEMANNEDESENICLPNVECESLNEIQSNEDNSTMKVDEHFTSSLEAKCKPDGSDNNQHSNEFNLSIIFQNCKNNLDWVDQEIIQPFFNFGNLNEHLIDFEEKETVKSTSNNVQNRWENDKNSQTAIVESEVEIGEKLNFILEDNLNERTKKENILKYCGAGENHPTDEQITDEHLLKIHDELNSKSLITILNNNIISDAELQTKENLSGSDCELGVRYTIKQLKNECSDLEISKEDKNVLNVLQDKPMKTKVQMYSCDTDLPRITNSKHNSKDEASTLKTKTVEDDCETKPFIQIPFENTFQTSESSFTEIYNKLLKPIGVSDDQHDALSICSEDSWDCWISKLITSARLKGLISADDSAETSVCQDQGGECDCVKSHCCLKAVDSCEERGVNQEKQK